MSASHSTPRGGSAPPRRRPSNRTSRTRPPEVAADLSLWPWWTNLPLERLNLDAFGPAGELLGTNVALGGGD